jgi:hypothetical protein
VLIIGAHPDDADIKAGGTAAMWRDHGAVVRLVSLTNGRAGHHSHPGADLARRRKAEAEASARSIGATYEVLNKVLDTVRRLRRAQAWRGQAGRKRRRGRPSKLQQARRQRQGPTAKDMAAFVWQHRYLLVKRTVKLTSTEWRDLVPMFAYLPELRPL